MALSKRDIQRLKTYRTAIPNKLYIEEPDRSGRSNYYIGTNDNRLRIISQEEYNNIVNPVTPVINNITNTTGTNFVAGGDLSGTATNQTVEKILNNTVPPDAAGSLTNDGAGTLTWTPGGAGYITGIDNTGNDVTLAVALGVLTANLTSLNISQFTNDSGYITSVPPDYISSILDTSTIDLNVSGGGQLTANFINAAGYITSSALSPYLTSATAASTYEPIISSGTTSQYWRGDKSWQTFPTIPTVTPAALTKTDDTNVTLTLGGTPSTALLQATSLTLGWTGTLADGRIASASTWNAKIGGSGTTNEIAYFTAASTIASLTTATYPSLTELSYVKGVTSAIQTQLNTISVDRTIKTYQALGSNLITQTCGVQFNRINTSTIALTDGQIVYIALDYIYIAQTITGLLWWQSVIGSYTADNNNKVGLFSYSGGTMTLVASCANDGNLWKTAGTNTLGSKAFSSPYSAAAGQYFIGILYNKSAGATDPQLGGVGNVTNGAIQIFNFTNSAKLVGYVAAQTDLPATQAMSGVTTTINLPWVGVY